MNEESLGSCGFSISLFIPLVGSGGIGDCLGSDSVKPRESLGDTAHVEKSGRAQSPSWERRDLVDHLWSNSSCSKPFLCLLRKQH